VEVIVGVNEGVSDISGVKEGVIVTGISTMRVISRVTSRVTSTVWITGEGVEVGVEV
jgi:hypothetical protein